jgi:non-ribosomal peptide synthase protein (TIGR01720 family)
LKPQVSFNYLGTFASEASSELFSVRSDPIGDSVSQNAERPFELELFGLVLKSQLEFNLAYNRNRFREQTMSALLDFIRAELEVVMRHCREKRGAELTPADLTYSKLSLDELETLLHD